MRRRRKEDIIWDRGVIEIHGKGHASEFKDAFAELSATTINNILRDLREDGLVSFSGPRKTGYWSIVPK